ncbi:hypothetical protein PMI13_03250 [Chryseobacterium populi]|uniref:Uncharacterized protein n=1 Tax=Chryseobacterium populi TaxID=1144316 RepID=J2SUZ5_9FLAO|nr:hypothetical protein PMI13_03250 [Chryseobacterium populi]
MHKGINSKAIPTAQSAIPAEKLEIAKKHI